MKRKRSTVDKSKHYVDNVKLYEEFKKRAKAVREAEDAGEEKPMISDYIAESIMKISERIGTRPNFRNYTYLDEMIGDGIENAIRYIDSFDPEKSNNPFTYLSTTIYYTFVRRINKEKKEQYTKYKSIEKGVIDGSLANQHTAAPLIMDIDTSEVFTDNMKTFMINYENYLTDKGKPTGREPKKKRKPRKKKNDD